MAKFKPILNKDVTLTELDDKGLFYLSKGKYDMRYHSPLEITIDSKTF